MCKSDCKNKTATPVVTPAMTATLQAELSRLGIPLSDYAAASALLEKVLAAPRACPNAVHMAEHACADKTQCWEPCGELGHSAEHARVAPAHLQNIPLHFTR